MAWLVLFGGSFTALLFVMAPGGEERADAQIDHAVAPVGRVDARPLPSTPTGLPAALPARWAPGEPGTEAAGRVLGVLSRIHANLRSTTYTHRTRVREARGEYHWDCSGMADWILRRAAPVSRRGLRRERPVAASFYHAIERAPTRAHRRGWQRLARLEDARPGDVFAWLRPPDWPPRNTGHVGFVLTRPRPVSGAPGAFELRIADATSVPHQDDTRTWPGDGGFGTGTIVFLTDDVGQGTHYAWHGARGIGYAVQTDVLIGRVHR